jgi:hypothetical protein
MRTATKLSSFHGIMYLQEEHDMYAMLHYSTTWVDEVVASCQ